MQCVRGGNGYATVTYDDGTVSYGDATVGCEVSADCRVPLCPRRCRLDMGGEALHRFNRLAGRRLLVVAKMGEVGKVEMVVRAAHRRARFEVDGHRL